MSRKIYILTTEAGKSIHHSHVTEFNGAEDLRRYAADLLACTTRDVTSRMTIDDLCTALDDRGPGFGMRRHNRISRREAIRYIREGAANNTLL